KDAKTMDFVRSPLPLPAHPIERNNTDDVAVDRQRYGNARHRPQEPAALPIGRIWNVVQTRVTDDFAGKYGVERPGETLSRRGRNWDWRNTVPFPSRWMGQLTIGREPGEYAAIEIEGLADPSKRG